MKLVPKFKVSELYTDGKDVWVCDKTEIEPKTLMRRLSDGVIREDNTSKFNNFVHLIPEIKLRKERSDAGKKKKLPGVTEVEPVVPLRVEDVVVGKQPEGK